MPPPSQRTETRPPDRRALPPLPAPSGLPPPIAQLPRAAAPPSASMPCSISRRVIIFALIIVSSSSGRKRDYTALDEACNLVLRIAQLAQQRRAVLADLRRIRPLRQPPAVELDRERRNVRSLAGVPRLEQAAGSLEVRVVEQVPGLGDRRERHADRLQLGRQRLGAVLPGDLVDAGNEP